MKITVLSLHNETEYLIFDYGNNDFAPMILLV